MRDTAAFQFVPDLQEEGAEPVEFTLTPLDLGDKYTLQAALTQGDNRMPPWPVVEPLIRKHVVGWKGLPQPFSRAELHRVLTGSGDGLWVGWCLAIVVELYRRSRLTEIERKN